MPWNETSPVNERLKFVAAVQRGDKTMAELCRDFGISSKTGYKLVARYEADGPEGLRDRSRAPRSSPQQTRPDIEAAILRARKAHPTWGSKKLLVLFERERGADELPVRSTIDAILKRAGVMNKRRRRARLPARSAPVVDAREPNDVWTMDFKGWFRVADGTRCDPLTANDVCSRAALECRAMVSPKLEDVRYKLERTFDRYGLPGCQSSV